MAAKEPLSDQRVALIASVMGEQDAAVFLSTVASDKSSMADTLSALKAKLSDETLRRLTLANDLASIAGDRKNVVDALLSRMPNAASLGEAIRSISFNDLVGAHEAAAAALTLGVQEAGPSGDAGEDHPDSLDAARALRKKFFAVEPTAVLHRMILDDEIKLCDNNVRDHVATFFSNQPDLNLGKASVLAALSHPKAFSGIAEGSQAKVETAVKQLAAVHLLATTPESVPKLIKANVTSAFQISSMPEATFVKSAGKTLGEDEAQQIHRHAVRSRRRNEHALVTMLQATRGSGIAAVDGPGTLETRKVLVASKLNEAVRGDTSEPNPPPVIDLESLFGSLDYCECSDCQSVLSPSAYLVELLQFLRNNTLSWDKKTFPNSGQDGIEGTALETLFARRPDLGCIELTCANINTILPYIDLANEVMESFVVHRAKYADDPHDPKHTINVYNVADEASSELLAQPQHTNYQAYCIIKDAVFPIVNAPYHQAIDEARVFLEHLKSSRYEVLSTFQPRYVESDKWSDSENQALAVQHQRILDRSAAAEFWGMTHIDYIAITRESYWPVEFWEVVKHRPNISPEEYHSHISRKKPWKYWGFESEQLMLDDDPTTKTGLMFVKAQLLRRSGLVYSDLADLVQTRYINPNYPTGRDLQILQSIHFSYKYLKGLIDHTKGPSHRKYAKLAKFLLNWRPWAIHHGVTRDNLPSSTDIDISAKELSCWVRNWFELLGGLIILESDSSRRLPFEGYVVAAKGRQDLQTPRLVAASTTASIDDNLVVFGYLNRDGSVVDDGEMVGSLAPDGTLVDTENQPFMDSRPGDWWQVGILDSLVVNNPKPEFVKPRAILYRATSKLYWPDSVPSHGAKGTVVEYLPVVESCNIDNVRLIHLDGTSLTCDEWDRMQSFIRLYRKLGFTIDETDQALSGLQDAARRPDDEPTQETTMDEITDWSQIKDKACISCGHHGGNCNCGDQEPPECDECPPFAPSPRLQITPDFLEQLIAVKKLQDLSSINLVQLLTLWTDIPTRGNPSLYSKLFLVHNISAIDPVFRPNINGNFLVDESAKIQDHIPVLLATFRIKLASLEAVISLDQRLSLQNVSWIYRNVLMSKILGTRLELLPAVAKLLGDPFATATATLDLVKLWTKMADKGFSFTQLNYLVGDQNDPLRPIGPSDATILGTTKAIFDGLHDIDTQNPDYTASQIDTITVDLVRSKASQIFDAAIAESIVGLVQGTTTYTTNAPSGLEIVVPDSLKSKLQYSDNPTASPPRATLTVTGIFTVDETMAAKKLADSTGWASAIDRVGKQATRFFDNYLSVVFANPAEAKAMLLAGDVPPPPPPKNDTDPPPPDNSTAPGKKLYLLQGLMPYIRDTLSRTLVISAVSSPANLSTPEMATVVLSTILKIGDRSTSALQILMNIQKEPPNSSSSWEGFLIPSSTESFIFYTKGGFQSQPPALTVGTATVPFEHQQEDPDDVWYTNPLPLVGGKLYSFNVSGQGIGNLQWATARRPPSDIPTSSLLPDYASQPTKEVFENAYKASLLINNFNLSLDEVMYLYANASDFASLDFNAVSVAAWTRLANYATFRDSLPAMPKKVLDLFKWAKANPSSGDIASFVNSVTNWPVDDVTQLIAPSRLNLADPKLFVTEIPLLLIQRCVAVKTKIAVDVDLLFKWADPLSFLWDRARGIAESIKKQVRSRYDVDSWEKIAQPLFNTLRWHQRDALIAFLLVQKPLQEWGVIDADSLFEFFLIDVQMSSCLQTSRIKQAISSVQLFIERVLMNLERDHGVDNSKIHLDKTRWNSWMHGYRLWQADREVFLWPENWLDPILRDNKSVYFKALESKLLQKDVNVQNVQDAMKNYLFSVDAVSKVDVIGLVQEYKTDTKPGALHIFAKSLSSPWAFFYRQLLDDGTWKPWEPMGVDILTYDWTDTGGNLIRTGTYLLPVVWNSRLLVFLPQFSKVRKPLDDTTKPGDMQNHEIKDHVIEYWEIKLGWTEYRNGAWTTKQIASQAVSKVPEKPPATLPGVNQYQFVPRISGTAPDTTIEIGVFQSATDAIGAFVFDGSQVLLGDRGKASFKLANSLTTDFHFKDASDDFKNPSSRTMYSFQDNGPPQTSPLSLYSSRPWAVSRRTPRLRASQGLYYNFSDPISHKLLARATTAPTLDGIFGFFETKVGDDLMPDVFGSTEYPTTWASDYNEVLQPYSLYHWEIGCHAPMLLMNKFLATQQFEEALAVAHYVFNPFAKRSSPPQPGDVWRWPPFKNVLPENALETLFARLKPKEPNTQGDAIESWRDNPFQPFVVARSRRQAFMRWFAIQYIKILIQWGDYYFMQNTLETIPYAIQLYVRASHIYGPRSMAIPVRGRKKPQTYNSLLDRWDGFSNAVVQMELAFPFSNQSDKPLGKIYDENVMANLFGFATSTYFCVPNNKQLLAVRDLIDDRLYKIRHCMDINGMVRQLPLFEPPLDPGLLVQAAAAGLNLSSVISDLFAPLPNYRCYLLIQKALELCSELKGIGSLFLSTKEKIDNETLAEMRGRQEVSMSNLIMQIKTQALTDANLTLDQLRRSRLTIEYKMRHFLTVIGESIDRIPGEDADFQELDDSIEALSLTNNPMRIMSFESAETTKASDANDQNTRVAYVETLAASLHIIPNVDAQGQPWGIGIGLRWGAENFAAAASAIARWMKIQADDLTYESSNASRMAGFKRQLQDRLFQVNSAGHELKNLDGQIKTQMQKVAMANQEVTNQQTAIDHANEVHDFLRNKYTNVALYSWMDNRLQTLHYQLYTQAFQLAKKAERAYCFERGIDPSSATYISFGYWDQGHDGLLAGEGLLQGLKRLEADYHEERGHDFEITRHVSLRQHSPLALFDLRETAACEVELPEVLFDMDFPGHYMRRIKSVALSIPCVAGPYTSISCTLRLLESEYRVNPIAADKGSYPKSSDGSDDDRFRTAVVPVSAIAVSSAQNDAGLFEVTFRDERYVPFEGAGAASRWRLELPAGFRQWDYGTVADVVMHIRYTAKDGGAKLGQVAAGAVADFVRNVESLSQDQGLFAMFDLRSEFATEWARAAAAPAPGSPDPSKKIIMKRLIDRLPAYTKGRDPKKILSTDLFLMLSPNPNWVSQADLLTADGTNPSFGQGDSVGQTAVWKATGVNTPIADWTLQLGGSGNGTLTKGYLIIRYELR